MDVQGAVQAESQSNRNLIKKPLENQRLLDHSYIGSFQNPESRTIPQTMLGTTLSLSLYPCVHAYIYIHIRIEMIYVQKHINRCVCMMKGILLSQGAVGALKVTAGQGRTRRPEGPSPSCPLASSVPQGWKEFPRSGLNYTYQCRFAVYFRYMMRGLYWEWGTIIVEIWRPHSTYSWTCQCTFMKARRMSSLFCGMHGIFNGSWEALVGGLVACG